MKMQRVMRNEVNRPHIIDNADMPTWPHLRKSIKYHCPLLLTTIMRTMGFFNNRSGLNRGVGSKYW